MGSLEPGHSNGGSAPAAAAVAAARGKGSRAASSDRQPGASMMEQLVPEITTHALSYLDYPSLCRLSMTNSAMRRAANDDNAWKALYHKDFTVEQDNITPPNGWKSYYAVTKAVIKANSAFYNSIKDRSLSEMGHVWLNADYVKCIHGSGELYTGYTAVMESWAMAFNWFHHAQGGAFEIRDVRPRIFGSIAWVTMRAFVEMSPMPFHVTNVYELHSGRWHLVHHHTSIILVDGEVEQLNFLE